MRLLELPIIKYHRGILNVHQRRRLRQSKLFISPELRELQSKELSVPSVLRGCRCSRIKSHVETIDRAFFRQFQVHHHTDMNLTFTLLCLMAVIWSYKKCEAAPEPSNIHHKFRSRPIARGYTVENSFGESDDYGHMRFGKREEYDDYGHLRFGRRLE
ncbi:drosulfakinin [Nomia melanderi]|uniref:drosulfakinin n=1 Tax=Nomia melanderi TaxID=2448451 RepID=UPI0013045DEE|nr:uncharacterized protein LOC116434061 [Nomia melanderi]